MCIDMFNLRFVWTDPSLVSTRAKTTENSSIVFMVLLSMYMWLHGCPLFSKISFYNRPLRFGKKRWQHLLQKSSLCIQK